MTDLLATILALVFPFERIPSWEVYGLTVRLSSLVILIFFLAGLPYLIIRKRIKLTILDCLVLGYLLVVWLSVLTSLDKNQATLAALLVSFVSGAYWLVGSKFSAASNFSKNIIGVAIVICGFGLYQFFADSFGVSTKWTGLLPRYSSAVLGFPRVQAVSLEPLYFASYLFIPYFLLLARAWQNRLKPIGLVALHLVSVVFFLTLSRGAFFSLLVSLVFLVVFGGGRAELRTGLRVLLATTISGALIALMSVFAVSGVSGLNRYWSQARIVKPAVQVSTEERLSRGKQALGLFLERPITGVGIGNFAKAINSEASFTNRPIVNNQYLETLAETGVVGLVSLLMIIGLALKALLSLFKRSQSVYALCLAAILTALVIQYNFFSTIYFINFWIVLGLIRSELRGNGRE